MNIRVMCPEEGKVLNRYARLAPFFSAHKLEQVFTAYAIALQVRKNPLVRTPQV